MSELINQNQRNTQVITEFSDAVFIGQQGQLFAQGLRTTRGSGQVSHNVSIASLNQQLEQQINDFKSGHIGYHQLMDQASYAASMIDNIELSDEQKRISVDIRRLETLIDQAKQQQRTLGDEKGWDVVTFLKNHRDK